MLEYPARSLLLIRHSAVSIDHCVSSNEWSLSYQGRARCRQFALQIASFQPDIFVTSEENKAIQTGKLLAHALGLPVESARGLHEHDRQGVPLFKTPKEFRSAVRQFFANPEELVFGRETAAQAGDRFDSAITRLLHQHQHHNLAVVTHGTVMTLFVCRHNLSLEPTTFWTSLQMPCAALIRLPDMTLQDLILPTNP